MKHENKQKTKKMEKTGEIAKRNYSKEEDQKILALVKSGDTEAYSKIMKKYFGYIKQGFYFKVGRNVSLAEDLATEVLEKAFFSLDKYEETKESSFNAWIKRIAQNRLIDHIRELKAQSYTQTVSADFVDPNNENSVALIEVSEESVLGKILNPEQIFLKDERREEIMKCMLRLDKRSQLLLKLCYLDGFSYKEIAKKTGMILNNVQGYLFRAKKRLEVELLTVAN